MTEFARKASLVRNDVLVAIDPGTTGAIAFKCRDFYAVVDIPTVVTRRQKTRKTTKRDRAGKWAGRKWKTIVGEDRAPDHAGIIALFRLLAPLKDRVHTILEDVPVTVGRGRKFADIMLGRAYAMWPLFLKSKRYAGYHEQKPYLWKGEFALGADKKASLRMARTMYPAADLPLAAHHNRAEALLILEYLRRKLAGKLKET